VSREISRNGGRDGYRALVADAAAFERARRPKSSKLAANPELRDVVADKLDDDWSPQQIAQWLRREYLDDAAMQISHESIYRDLYMPSRKVFDASMFHRLRGRRRVGHRAPRTVGELAQEPASSAARGPSQLTDTTPKRGYPPPLPALRSRKSHQGTDQKKPRPVGESPDTGSVFRCRRQQHL
jgi:IS30 family transposase